MRFKSKFSFLVLAGVICIGANSFLSFSLLAEEDSLSGQPQSNSEEAAQRPVDRLNDLQEETQDKYGIFVTQCNSFEIDESLFETIEALQDLLEQEKVASLVADFEDRVAIWISGEGTSTCDFSELGFSKDDEGVQIKHDKGTWCLYLVVGRSDESLEKGVDTLVRYLQSH